MTFKIGKYYFENPVALDSGGIKNAAGIYCILGRKKPTSEKDSHEWNIIYVGQSGEVKDRIKDHERKSDWEKKAREDELLVAVLYESNENKRLSIEKEIRDEYKPPCNKQ